MEDIEAMQAMEEQRMEVIRKLVDLERERFKEANKLRRKAHQNILRIDFSQLEEGYGRFKEIHDRFTSRIDDWIELLEINENGEPTYPERGMPESRYNPEYQDLARKTSQLEEILTSARDALANFILSLPGHEQIYIIQEAILPFHKNLDAIKAYCAEKSIGYVDGREREDDENTVVNGGGGAAREKPEDQEHNVFNPGGDNLIPSPCTSPRNSLNSSKSLKIDRKSYQVRKQRINILLS